jgi:hypothetical protein
MMSKIIKFCVRILLKCALFCVRMMSEYRNPLISKKLKYD